MRTKIRQKKKDPKPRTIACVGDAKHTVFDDEDTSLLLKKVSTLQADCITMGKNWVSRELDSLRIRRRSWKVRNDRTIFVSGRGDHRRS